MASCEEIEAFLANLKVKLRVYDVVFRYRDNNLETLAELDIMPNDRIEVLRNLSVANYMAGPHNDTFDHTKPEYFEFGAFLKGREIYIKLSLGLANKAIDCMSFHIAKWPINYPYS